MTNDFHDRAENLEEQFFRRQDKELIEKLAKLKRSTDAKEALARVSGVTDPKVLERLVELEITPEQLVALAVVPLVEVAWADGEIQAKERQAVIDAARSLRHGAEPLAPGMLESWLDKKPDPKLLSTWQLYVQGLCASLTPDERGRLREQILGHARQVAESAGGILGLGSKVSQAEEKILARLAKSFET
jgi:hypothetical protein